MFERVFLQQDKAGTVGLLADFGKTITAMRSAFVLRQVTHPGVYMYPNGIKFHTKSN